MNYTIYSIEDDKDIALIINKTLTKQGYIVKTFYDAASFFEAFKEQKPDMILLDMMLPDKSGKEILTEIRSDIKNDDIDVIIISANHMVIDKVEGLDLGADDYIGKPFDLLELMSRVSARFRRKKRQNILTLGDLVLDFDKFSCTYEGKDIALTAKEFQILSYLIKNKDKVVKREELLNEIYGVDTLETRSLDMHIKSIRKKIKEDIVQTVYGIGYKVMV
ncbi:MAG TPA: response regulator transcription factor [Erysipelotrichaceae bacterium]|nr:response regulator transcription factor [Erysipelotrichaceae bacterium]